MANFVKVAQTSEIPAGQGKCVEVEGRRLAIFNVDGSYYAIEYDVTNGINTFDTDLKQEQFQVKVDGNDILVAL